MEQRIATAPDGVTLIDCAVRLSPICFPMHDHSEASQVAQGGNYNCGMISGILFTGDLGASILPAGRPFAPVDDFDAHVSLMEGFHRRYMAAGRICKLWAHMVRELDLEWIVPQHGVPFSTKDLVVTNGIYGSAPNSLLLANTNVR